MVRLIFFVYNFVVGIVRFMEMYLLVKCCKVCKFIIFVYKMFLCKLINEIFFFFGRIYVCLLELIINFK